MSLCDRIDILEEVFSCAGENLVPDERNLTWGREQGLTDEQTTEIWNRTVRGRPMTIYALNAFLDAICDHVDSCADDQGATLKTP